MYNIKYMRKKRNTLNYDCRRNANTRIHHSKTFPPNRTKIREEKTYKKWKYTYIRSHSPHRRIEKTIHIADKEKRDEDEMLCLLHHIYNINIYYFYLWGFRYSTFCFLIQHHRPCFYATYVKKSDNNKNIYFIYVYLYKIV